MTTELTTSVFPAVATMTDEAAHWAALQAVLHDALACAPCDRAAFLEGSCLDAEARREVEELLAGHDRVARLDALLPSVIPSLSAPSRRAALPAAAVPPRYEVIEQLAAGGMGVVYKARDSRLDRLVVLKFLAPHLSADEVAKEHFLREARAAAALEHTNICTIHEIGETADGQLYIVMAHYEGETVAEKITRGPLAITDALTIASGVARGLSKAHERGIIHRDIKPANVIVTADGVVKILDFGIAKLADQSVTQPGTRVGTLAYMSPEQAIGDEIDHRTDIWSLGAVLYEMLAGERPFPGETEQARLSAILVSDVECVSAVRADVPPSLDALVRRALAKKPADRFESMHDMSADIAAVTHTTSTMLASGRRSAMTTASRTAKLHDSELSRPGERRHATVLTAVVAGWASLVESVPAHELESTIAAVRTAATQAAALNGGIVNSFEDDEIVVLFGVPIAHEDDFLCGVRTAIAYHERVRAISAVFEQRFGVAVHLRIGIDTGVIFAQRLRTGDRRYRVTGSATSVAAQLAALAPQDGTLVSPECQRLITPFFHTTPYSPVTLRAAAPPCVPFLVAGESGVASRLEYADRTGLTPYAGRARELTTLAEYVARARQGNGALVVVVGEPGTGKSRLLYELRQHLDTAVIRVLQGRCHAYGGTTPYLPFVEALRDALELRRDRALPDEPHDDVVSRIRALDPSLEDYIPFYLHLLAIPSSLFAVPEHLRGKHLESSMLEALAAFYTVFTRRAPTVLLLEDWHWVDIASRAVLRQLAEVVTNYPLLLVVASRPDPGVDSATLDAAQIVHLGPLDASSSRSIMQSVLGGARMSHHLAEHLCERTSGNPFFIEEVCHALVEAGVVTICAGDAVVVDTAGMARLPDTVQSVIRTRVDRLDTPARDVLRVASVVGRDFGREILARVIDASVTLGSATERLKASGLIQQTSVAPEISYRFKHVLTQEVVYDSLLQHQRITLHAMVGRAIEQLYPDRLDENAELLMHHFSRAERWREAVRYGLSAAARTAALCQFTDALGALDRTYAWLAHLPDDGDHRSTLADILFRQERLCETLGLRGRQRVIVDELIAMLLPHGPSPELAEAYLRLGDLCTLLRQFDAADAALATALGMSRERRDQAGERKALRSLGLLRWHEGRSEDALVLAEEALALDRARGDMEAIAGDLTNMGQILMGMRDHDRALQCFEEAVAVSRKLNSPIKQQFALHGLGNAYHLRGDVDEALRCLQEADDISRRLKDPIQRSHHVTSIAHVMLEQGRVEESVRLYQEAVDLSRLAGTVALRSSRTVGHALSVRIMGELLFGLGREAEALPYLREGAALFAMLEDGETEMLLQARIAKASEGTGHPDDAIAAWHAARSHARRLSDPSTELDAVEGLARVTRHQIGDAGLALPYYEEALALALATDDRNRAAALRNSLGIIHWERGAYTAALDHYKQALGLFRQLKDPVNEGLVLNSLGVTLERLGRYGEARATLDQGAACNRASGAHHLEAHSLAALGDIYVQLDEMEKAEEHFDRSLAIRRNSGDRAAEVALLRHVAGVYRARGNTSAAAEADAAAAAAGWTTCPVVGAPGNERQGGEEQDHTTTSGAT
ncbi:MAG: hypothetical protein NVS1B4_18510 [Gemmatimonadaceae bacterium]